MPFPHFNHSCQGALRHTRTRAACAGQQSRGSRPGSDPEVGKWLAISIQTARRFSSLHVNGFAAAPHLATSAKPSAVMITAYRVVSGDMRTPGRSGRMTVT